MVADGSNFSFFLYAKKFNSEVNGIITKRHGELNGALEKKERKISVWE